MTDTDLLELNAGSLSVEVNDQGNIGKGGLLRTTATIPVSVASVNDASEVRTLQSKRTDRDQPLVLDGYSAVSIRDVDAGTNAVTVVLSVTDGSLAIGGDTSGLSSWTGNGSSSVEMTGTVSAINAALATVTFTPAAGFSGTATLTVTADDLGFTGAGGPQTDTDTTRIIVSPAWDGVGEPPAAPGGGSNTQQAQDDHEAALAEILDTFESWVSAASQELSSTQSSADDARTQALADALETYEAAVTAADSANSDAISQASAALVSALGAFATYVTGYSFGDFAWPETPDPLEPNATGPAAPSAPSWTGPQFDPATDPGFQAALQARSAIKAAALAAAEATYRSALDTARQQHQDRVRQAEQQRRDDLEEAQTKHEDALDDDSPHTGALEAAQTLFNDRVQTAQTELTTDLQSAQSTYATDAQAAWDAYINATPPGTSEPARINAWHAYVVAMAEISNVNAHSVMDARLAYGNKMRTANSALASAQWQHSDWPASHRLSANNTFAIDKLNAEQRYQDALADSQRIWTQAQSDALKIRDVAQATATAEFDGAIAAARATATATWAAVVGTPWAAYQSQQAANRAAYDQAVATAYHTLSTNMAEARRVRDNAVADEKQERTEGLNEATRDRDVSRAGAATGEATSRLSARAGRRNSDAASLKTRGDNLAARQHAYSGEMSDAQMIFAINMAGAWRTYALAVYDAWQSYYSSDDDDQLRDDLDTAADNYRHQRAPLERDFALTRLDRGAAYEDESDVIRDEYRDAIQQHYADFIGNIGTAHVRHVTTVALADATFTSAKANADAAYRRDVAAAEHTYAMAQALRTHGYDVALAQAQRDLSVNDATAHQTFANGVMQQHLQLISQWVGGAALASPVWAVYHQALAAADARRVESQELLAVITATHIAALEQLRSNSLANSSRTHSEELARLERELEYDLADADKLRAITKAYAPFDAIGGTYDPTYDDDFARDFVAAFAPRENSNTSGDDEFADMQQRNSRYETFQDTMTGAARTRNRRLINAWYDYQMDNLSWAAYQAEVTAANDQYQDTYADARENLLIGIANDVYTPYDPPPIDNPPVWYRIDEIRFDAAGRMIDADKEWKVDVADAERQAALDAAAAERTLDLAFNNQNRITDGLIAVEEQGRANAAAGIAADYSVGAAIARAKFEVDLWTALRDQKQAAAGADPSPLNVYYAAAAQQQLDWIIAKTTSDVSLARLTGNRDALRASRMADAELTREITTLNAARAYADNSANAAKTYADTLANEQHDRVSSDAADESTYRHELASANIDHTLLEASAKALFSSQRSDASFDSASANATAFSDYLKGLITYQQCLDIINAQAQAGAGTIGGGRTDYVENSTQFYLEYITRLADLDIELANDLAYNEFVYAIDVQIAADDHASALRGFAATLRTAEADAERDHAVAVAQATQEWVAGTQADTVTAAAGLIAPKTALAAQLADAEADYHIGVAQQQVTDLLANGGPTAAFEALRGQIFIQFIENARPAYAAYLTTLARADAEYDHAQAVLQRNYQNVLQNAEVAAVGIHANARRTYVLAEGAAADALEAARDDALGDLAVDIADINASAVEDSAVVRGDHAVAIAEAHRDHDIAINPFNKASTYSQNAAARTQLTKDFDARIVDINADFAARLGDVAVQWVTDASDAAQDYLAAYRTALTTHAVSTTNAYLAYATTAANADRSLALARAGVQAGWWIDSAIAARARDSAQAGATVNFFLAQQQQNAVNTVAFVTELAGAVDIVSLHLRADTGASATDGVTTEPTVAGQVDNGGRPNFILVEFDHDADGDVDGSTYTEADGDFSYTPQGVPAGSVTLKARTSVDGAVSGWTSLAYTLTADPLVANRVSTLAVSGMANGVAPAPALSGSITATSGSLDGVTVEFDHDGNGTVDGTALTTSGGAFSYTAAGLSNGHVTLAARTVGGAWTHVAVILADSAAAPQAVRGYTTYLVSAAESKYAWAVGIAAAWLANADAVSGTRVTYANAVAADQWTMATISADAAFAYAQQVASATASRAQAAVTADVTYLVGVAPLERTYRLDSANVERDYQVDLAEAKRDPATQNQKSLEATDERADKLADARRTYASAEQALAATRASQLGAASLASATQVAGAATARVGAVSSAAQAFAVSQAQQERDRSVQVAALDGAFAQLSASAMVEQAQSLASSSPSPWADQQVALTQAEQTRGATVGQAAQDRAGDSASAELTRAQTNAAAAAGYAQGLAGAEAGQYLATLQAESAYGTALLAVRGVLTYAGTYAAPLVFPIDAPELMGTGQAAAHLNDDAILLTVWVWAKFCGRCCAPVVASTQMPSATCVAEGTLTQAERGGFEPPVPFLTHSISSAAQSATLPPLRMPSPMAFHAKCVCTTRSYRPAH